MAKKQTPESKGPPYKGAGALSSGLRAWLGLGDDVRGVAVRDVREDGPAAKAHDGSVPNKVFAAKDTGFRQACERAGVQPTARQASKYRNGKGSAFKAK